MKVGKRKKEDGTEETYSYCTGFRYVQTYRLADFPISREEVEKALGYHEDEQSDIYKIAESKIAKAIKIVHDDAHTAFYVPSAKYINMPELKYLTSSEEATRTLLHEAVHATMQWQERGLSYGDEEAVAELGSMFLASEFGIEIDMRNSLKYIWGWLGIPDGLFGYHKFIKIEDLKPEERAIIDKVTKLFDITKSAVDSLRKHVAQAESSTNLD